MKATLRTQLVWPVSVRSSVGSEPAFGSVIEKADFRSPLSSGSR